MCSCDGVKIRGLTLEDGSGAGLLRYGKSRSVGGEEGTVQEEELLSLQHFVGLFINWDSAQNRQGSHG